MTPKTSTAASVARDFRTIDLAKPCTECGSMAGREHSDGHVECSSCGRVFQTGDSEPDGATDAEVRSAVQRAVGATDLEVRRAVERAESERA